MTLNMLEGYKNDMRREAGRAGDMYMPVDEIRIYQCFAEHPPRPEKMEQKEQYFQETGALQSQIILDGRGYLIDGYTSYLLARQHGIQVVPVRSGKRQIVKACHKSGGQSYVWELPVRLVDRVSAGDKVMVHTQRGIRAARVTAVEEYFPGEYEEPLRLAIRVVGKTGR